MSADAARAAEMLSQLSAPQRLAAFAELVRRGAEGATIAELAYTLDVPVQKSGELLARLVGAGLATGTGNGVYRANAGVLREAAAAVDKMQPLSPLLASYPQLKGYFAHGRLTSLPPTLSERSEQTGELIVRFLALDGLCDEDELNRRLARVTDDVAGVRRMLVDTGWLERDRAGTTYGPGRKLESDRAGTTYGAGRKPESDRAGTTYGAGRKLES
ncbi:DUF2087 domain-containing protein [Actinoplanes sp. TBRC 11911]|uniref:DUF2087 domain-containing protein n=1 Tax=Actinoplanes sp. TBRC 11911 TaxID=2729386 RepID=UPI00145DAF89|nr:DUF2087 domain-containing protein [Actinoplanes sp. TBRC 11911]NMO57403.1 DUF2087 domain-containing protein [Actinoplanes sp. TBRC 11911]